MNARIRDYCLRRGCSIFEVEGGLEYLVRAWERTAADVARGYRGLLAQQYVTDLRMRQLLHEVWPLAFTEERDEFGPRLSAADALFRDHTAEAVSLAGVLATTGAVQGFSNGAAYAGNATIRVSPEQWWYGREPKVRDEDW